MQAILLNSGQGTRMGTLTADKPKCLVELNRGETILYRQVKALTEQGIDEIVVTTGPFAEKIDEYLKTHFKGVNFKLVYNSRYEETNYIYSMYLAADNISADVILMHGDLVFDYRLLTGILSSGYENTVLVNPDMKLPVKDFKGLIKDGLVRQIGVNLLGENCYFLMPMYRLDEGTFNKWLDEIGKFIAAGKEKVYAEEALNQILNEVALYPFYYRDEVCFEIDDTDDLKKVKELIS